MMIDECCFRVLGRRLSLPWNREHKGMAREYSVGRWGDLLGMLMCKFDKTLYPRLGKGTTTMICGFLVTHILSC